MMLLVFSGDKPDFIRFFKPVDIFISIVNSGIQIGLPPIGSTEHTSPEGETLIWKTALTLTFASIATGEIST